MNVRANNPLSFKQIEAGLYMADMAIKKSDSLSSKDGKYYRGQAGYHLQQAAEKLIKIQMYESGIKLDNVKIYRHSLDDLMSYATSCGINLSVPKWIEQKKFRITAWEAQGRYDLHFVVRLDTLKKCYKELKQWYSNLSK